MSPDFVYLASMSPRRRELLTQIGVPFQVLEVSINEDRVPGEEPQAYVQRVARLKAESGWEIRPPRTPSPVLAADTTVVLDGRILVKPTDREDGVRMLRELSDRRHEVLTAVALATSLGVQSRLSRSEVAFRAISDTEAHDYWDTGEPQDKAGGYAIQGRAAIFVTTLRGSYSGVMGLPLYETALLLEQAGVPRWSGILHEH